MNKVKDNRTAKEVRKIGEIVYDVFEDGLRFIVMRGPAAWCAYVGVPETHPLAGHGYDDLPVDCHGGLTFSREAGDKWPKGYYWYGWDYAHAGDYTHFEEIGPRFSHESDKDWTVSDVVRDSWGALYDFKSLMKLAESIKNKV